MKKSFVMALVVVFLLGFAVSAADVAVLMSNYTRTWYGEVSWDFDADMETLLDTLELADISYIEISDEDLANGKLGSVKTLILPNNRRMSVAQVEATRAFIAQGGTVLTIMQTSFRDENNQIAGKSIQLSDVMGVEYEAFAWKPPLHGYIKISDDFADHPIFKGLPEFIKLARNWAFVVQHHDDVKVLGEWFNDDQLMPSHLPEINGAIMENAQGNVIYIAEMIFMPEHMEEPAVRTLATNIIEYLISKSTR